MKDSEDAERELQDMIKNAKSPYVRIPCSTVHIEKDDLCKVKDKVVDSLQKHRQRTKEFKDLLKRLKDENTRLLAQLDEKDGEIDRLQEEVANDAHLER